MHLHLASLTTGLISRSLHLSPLLVTCLTLVYVLLTPVISGRRISLRKSMTVSKTTVNVSPAWREKRDAPPTVARIH